MHQYWHWYLTYVLSWQVLVPVVVTGILLGLIAAKYSKVNPFPMAIRTIVAGNVFDIVVIGAELHVANKPILPALLFLPSTYGMLWIIYGAAMALGAFLLIALHERKALSAHWRATSTNGK